MFPFASCWEKHPAKVRTVATEQALVRPTFDGPRTSHDLVIDFEDLGFSTLSSKPAIWEASPHCCCRPDSSKDRNSVPIIKDMQSC